MTERFRPRLAPWPVIALAALETADAEAAQAAAEAGEALGLGDDRRFPLPLTQEILADGLGLSIVHVNRTLQHLRRDGLIELRSSVAILLQPQALQGVADYEAPRDARSA